MRNIWKTGWEKDDGEIGEEGLKTTREMKRREKGNTKLFLYLTSLPPWLKAPNIAVRICSVENRRAVSGLSSILLRDCATSSELASESRESFKPGLVSAFSVSGMTG